MRAAAAPAAPAPIVPNKGDTTWMLVSTAFVLLMATPGLAMFYGGLVRSKNVLSIYMQVLCGFSLLAVLWVIYGYSVAFTSNPSEALNPFFGGFSKMFLKGVITYDPASGNSYGNAATFSKGVPMYELVYAMFQLTFAAITPALIVGAFAERMKFSAVMLFLALWFTFAYLPIAHMVWFWSGPDAYTLSESNVAVIKAMFGDDAAKSYLDMAKPFLEKLKAVGTDKDKIQAILDDWSSANGAAAGFLFNKGALDFAGGTVVHINAGVAGLVCALVLGPRVGLGKENMAPHNLTMSVIGACLLWFGWFGFNAGSNLEASGGAALAFATTLIATATATLAWTFVEWIGRGHASALGAASGAVAGLVAITPAAGFVGPMGAIVIGAAAGVICYWAVTWLKGMFGYDDSLDVFGVHGVGGIVGALLTGVFVNPALGGAGVTNYASTDPTATSMAAYDMAAQMVSQLWGVGTSIVVTAVVSFVALMIIKVTIGLRVSEPAEREGLDITTHGERAYN
ncbi:ammonium transporter [Methyloraptor flagellatus]|uniref:Ammonium transporter n=1 Tax=Methyloraptor flagellatus TaxID=3162530 RepID=A0AAU7XGI1_9HYPH